MEADPWEALDLDDSDLPSFLRPCKRKFQNSSPPIPNKRDDCQRLSAFSQPPQPLTSLPTPKSPPSSSPTVVPGPAGAVQAAMLRKLENKNNPIFFGEEPLSTQEYIRRAIEDPGVDDDDFSRNPWLFALEFIRREGLSDNGGAIGTPLSFIKTEPKMGNGKVAQVVAIVKSCTPNGLGDLMVTLKDPTGTMDASIHRKVLVQGGFGKDISVGTVLILQKVSIFSPSRSACYLNITLRNIVQAISKDSEPLLQLSPASTVASTSLGVENSTQPWNHQKVSGLSSQRNEEIMNSLRQTGFMRGTVHNDKENEDVTSVRGCNINWRNRSQNALGRNEPSVRQDTFSGMKVGTIEHEENVVLDKQTRSKNLAGGENHLESNRNSDGANPFDVANDQENVIKNGDRQPPISRSSLPQWTDEQLDELCEFD